MLIQYLKVCILTQNPHAQSLETSQDVMQGFGPEFFLGFAILATYINGCTACKLL